MCLVWSTVVLVMDWAWAAKLSNAAAATRNKHRQKWGLSLGMGLSPSRKYRIKLPVAMPRHDDGTAAAAHSTHLGRLRASPIWEIFE